MTLVVPFDGSELSKAALVRATQFEEVLNESVIAVSVIPQGNQRYALEQQWISPDEEFDAQTIRDLLRESVAGINPSAEFHHVLVDRYAPRGTIANSLQNFARNHDASVVFLGSRNAGRIVTSLSVGRSVAADPDYDTMIVSAVRPSKAEKLEAVAPTAETLDG